MKVKVVTDLTDLGKCWGINYPKLNEILTVSSVKHYDGKAKLSTLMLKFTEYNNLPWMCKDDYKGNPNFEIIIDINKIFEYENRRAENS